MLKKFPSKSVTLLLLLVMMFSLPAHAYIGPGLGAGAIGVILGILASLVLVLLAIVWYPLKRLFKKKRDNEKDTAKNTTKEKD